LMFQSQFEEICLFLYLENLGLNCHKQLMSDTVIYVLCCSKDLFERHSSVLKDMGCDFVIKNIDPIGMMEIEFSVLEERRMDFARGVNFLDVYKKVWKKGYYLPDPVLIQSQNPKPLTIERIQDNHFQLPHLCLNGQPLWNMGSNNWGGTLEYIFKHVSPATEPVVIDQWANFLNGNSVDRITRKQLMDLSNVFPNGSYVPCSYTVIPKFTPMNFCSDLMKWNQDTSFYCSWPSNPYLSGKQTQFHKENGKYVNINYTNDDLDWVPQNNRVCYDPQKLKTVLLFLPIQSPRTLNPKRVQLH